MTMTMISTTIVERTSWEFWWCELYRLCLPELGLPAVGCGLQRANGPRLRSLGWRIRITPVGPDVEIRNTGPPGTGGDSDSSRTLPDPPTICTATPSGTRTSIEPQVSRWRLI